MDRDAAALSHYRAFLNAPGAFDSPLYDEGEYGAAYALFRQRKYRDAQVGFRKYIVATPGGDDEPPFRCLLRVGDCFFIDKDYPRAVRCLRTSPRRRDHAAAVCPLPTGPLFGPRRSMAESVAGMTALLEESPRPPSRATP